MISKFLLSLTILINLLFSINMKEIAINKAISDNNIEKLEELLHDKRITVDNMITPCLKTISDGKEDCLEVFLKAGFSPNLTYSLTPTDKNEEALENYTLLATAVEKKQLRCIKILLKYGADINFVSVKKRDTDKKRVTPLSLAIEANSNSLVDLLLENKANPNFTTTTNSFRWRTINLLTLALSNRNKYIFERLLKFGAINNDPNTFKIALDNNMDMGFLEKLLKGNFDFDYYKNKCLLTGNAHILTYKDISSLYEARAEGNISKIASTDFFEFYERFKKEYNSNTVLWRKKKQDFRNTLFEISGTVDLVRRSILNEYIVELETPNSILGVHVVFPEKISQKTIEKLTNLKKGEYFESLVYTREGSNYVDVPVWRKNNIYYAEP